MPLRNRKNPAHYLETLDAIIRRLCAANYYDDNVIWFNQYLSINRFSSLNFLSTERNFLKLSELTRISTERLWQMTFHRFLPSFYEDLSIFEFGKIIDRIYPIWHPQKNSHYLIKRTKRVCPICLEEYGSYLLPWLLVPVTTCLEHQVLLIDHCNNCGAILNYHSKVCSSCGFAIMKNPVSSIREDPLSLHLTDLIWAALGCGPDSFENTLSRIDKRFGQFIGTPPRYFHLLYKLAHLLLHFDPQNPIFEGQNIQFPPGTPFEPFLKSVKIETLHRIFLSAMECLSDWPNNYYRILERIAFNDVQEYQKNTYSRRRPFHVEMRETLNWSSWDWIWKEWVFFIQKSPNKKALPYSWLGYLADLPEELTANGSVFITLSKASEKLDVGARTLYQSVERTGLWIYRNGRYDQFPKFLLDENSLNELSKEKEMSFIPLIRLPQYLGVNRQVVELIVKEDWLKPEELSLLNSNIKLCYSIESVNSFIDKLVNPFPLKNLCQGHNPVTISKVVHNIALPGIDLIFIIKALLNKEIEAFHDPLQTGLQKIWFEKSQVIQFKKKILFKDQYSVYFAREVEKLIHTTKKNFHKLHELGLLSPMNPEDDITKWIYRVLDVKVFNEKYIDASCVGRILGISRSTVNVWVGRGWIMTVNGMANNGFSFYRFDKKYIEEWRNNHITTAEAAELLGKSTQTIWDWVASGRISPIENMGKHQFWFDRYKVLQLKQ